MRQLDLGTLPYGSQRQPVFARRGIVSTSQPLATQAGLHMLQRGGNAVDAAIAMAVALTVVEPTSNGIGGDLFALVWDGARLHGLNGSGRAPAALNLDLLRDNGHATMPGAGWLSVTVPGAPAGWRDLHDRFGRLRFASLFEPAIAYAEQGFAVPPVLARNWARAERRYRALSGAEFGGWHEVFAPAGRAPVVSEIWSSRAHARTLSLIAESGATDMYRGETARAILRWAAETGGVLTDNDLAAHRSTWVEPIHASYRGYDVWEMPPNGQGMAALAALQVLEGFDLGKAPRDDAQTYHLQIESIKLALADARRYIADPDRVPVPTEQLLSLDYAAERRALIGTDAREPEPGNPLRGGTVYMCAADADGMMVSLIQSNYEGFGSGIVVPGTGVSLQNRAAGFSIVPGHPNQVEGGKRPLHTIIPGFLTHNGRPIGPFGVMGGDMQPQGHVQMIVNTIDYGLNPQASLDAPRWRWMEGRTVHVESHMPQNVVDELQQRGHEIVVQQDYTGFGRGQIIWRLPNDVYVAGSDSRADGYAAGY